MIHLGLLNQFLDVVSQIDLLFLEVAYTRRSARRYGGHDFRAADFLPPLPTPTPFSYPNPNNFTYLYLPVGCP